jgi:signal transduction histidine kinase/CheY-like chemotaxis protein
VLIHQRRPAAAAIRARIRHPGVAGQAIARCAIELREPCRQMSLTDTDQRGEPLRQQTVLAKFGELALRSDDLDEILTEACRLVGEALGTDLAKVVELKAGGETLLVRAGVGWKPGIVGVTTIRATDDTSEAHAIRTGEPMISPDIDKEGRFSYPQFLIDNGVRAVANVVIIGGKDQPPFGILQVDSRTPRHFTGSDTDFLRSYANLIAAAVERLNAISALRNREARLRKSRDRQDAALRTGLIGFFDWDVPTNTVTADQRFACFYGLDPDVAAAGVPLDAILGLIHPEDRAGVEASVTDALVSLSDYRKEFRLVHRGGDVRWMLVRGHCYEQRDGRALHYTGTAVDVTASKLAEAALRRANEALEARVDERTRALSEANAKLCAEAEERERIEATLRQAYKMEAVGQLTGGLAHDFNNLLTGISGNLELMQKRIEQGRTSDLRRYTEAALVSANRAAAVTHRLLAFSRRQTLDPRPTNANELIRGMADLLRRTTGPDIGVDIGLVDELWPILCDANQLETALLNLVINARDAMPDGGRLRIDTGTFVKGDSPEGAGEEPVDVPPGEYVLLSISDTGVGMTASIAARAFDPFFTTKPIGQGTGLGLSMVYGFVQQSGGRVRLRSAEGQGTVVMIYLPRYLGDADAAHEVVAAASPERAQDDAVVVVVEDEPEVRMVIVDVLSDLGYTVVEASDSRSGLRVLETQPRVDLMVSDVGLPGGMNGRQLADAARQRRPALKVLFITGYAEAAALDAGLLERGMQVMTKPFGMDALAARVQAMIEGPSVRAEEATLSKTDQPQGGAGGMHI